MQTNKQVWQVVTETADGRWAATSTVKAESGEAAKEYCDKYGPLLPGCVHKVDAYVDLSMVG